jgi:DNA-binding NarL/FixJ family response regulator
MDMLMPELTGSQATRLIKQEQPEARTLVLASFAEPADAQAAIQAGTLGSPLKAAPPEELLSAIGTVAQGTLSLPREQAVLPCSPRARRTRGSRPASASATRRCGYERGIHQAHPQDSGPTHHARRPAAVGVRQPGARAHRRSHHGGRRAH